MAAISIEAHDASDNPFRPDTAYARAAIATRRIGLAFVLVASAFLLAGCGTNLLGRKDAPPPEIQLQGELSPGLRGPCRPPVDIPARTLLDREIVAGWNADRAALRDCAATKQALVRQHDIITGKIPIPVPRPTDFSPSSPSRSSL